MLVGNREGRNGTASAESLRLLGRLSLTVRRLGRRGGRMTEALTLSGSRLVNVSCRRCIMSVCVAASGAGWPVLVAARRR